VGTGVLFWGYAVGTWSWPPSGAEIKNEWNYTSNPRICLRGLNRDRCFCLLSTYVLRHKLFVFGVSRHRVCIRNVLHSTVLSRVLNLIILLAFSEGNQFWRFQRRVRFSKRRPWTLRSYGMRRRVGWARVTRRFERPNALNFTFEWSKIMVPSFETSRGPHPVTQLRNPWRIIYFRMAVFRPSNFAL